MAFQRRHPLIKRGWVRALLLFAVYLLLGIAAAAVVQHILPAGSSPGSASAPYAWMFIDGVLSFVVVFVFRVWIDRRSFASMGWSFAQFFPAGVIGFCIGVFLVCTGATVLFLSGSLQWTDAVATKDLYWSAATLLLVAFAEELVFRGYILRNLLKSFNRWVSLAISSSLFAAVHLLNPGIPVLGEINILLGGVLLGLAFLQARNLWMPAMLHFSWNFFQGPLLGFPVSGVGFKTLLVMTLSGKQLFTGGDFGFEGSIMCTVLLGAAVAWLLFNTKRFSA